MSTSIENKNRKKRTVKPKSKLRHWSGKLHLWIGLPASIIVFILGITGMILTYEPEISDLTFHNQRYADAETISANRLPVDSLFSLAATYRESTPFRTYVYNNPTKNVELYYYKGNQDAITFFQSIEEYGAMYINPYNGLEEGYIDLEYYWMVIVKYIHWSLLLASDVGQPIVGASTIIFVLLLFTGLVLWWPKRKKQLKRSLTIKWKSTNKKLNYDLHNVLGFYFTPIMLVLGLTGLVWAYVWFKTMIYVIASFTTTPPPPPPTFETQPVAQSIEYPLQAAVDYAFNKYPDAYALTVAPPANENDVIRIGLKLEDDIYYKAVDLQIDPYTLEELDEAHWKDRNAGEQLVRMNYDIHTGAAFGPIGRFLAFIASGITAMLSITGVIVWWNKGKKFP